MVFILTVTSHSDDYKRPGSYTSYQNYYVDKELARRGLLVHLLNEVNDNALVETQHPEFLTDYMSNDQVNSLAVIKAVDEGKINAESFCDSLQEHLFGGEFVESTIEWAIVNKGETINTKQQVDANIEFEEDDTDVDIEEEEEKE